MIVCHCKGKTHRDIEAAATQGASSLREVAAMCHAGSECGGCLEVIRKLLETSRHGSDRRRDARPQHKSF